LFVLYACVCVTCITTRLAGCLQAFY
jgi:hypothetical protein